MYTFVAFTCLLGAAVAAPHGSLGYAAYDSVSIPNYGFSYAVNDPITGDNKAQHEVREGDVVKGSYSLAEPDGTIRVVDYRADPVSGFNAVVKNIGHSVHPQRLHAPVISKPIVAPVVAPIAAPIASSYVSSSWLGNAGLGLGGLGHGNLGLGHGNLGLGLSNGNLGLGHGNIGLGYSGLSGLNGLEWGQGGWGHGGWGHGGWSH